MSLFPHLFQSAQTRLNAVGLVHLWHYIIALYHLWRTQIYVLSPVLEHLEVGNNISIAALGVGARISAT